jgi:predicted amidophosphoribosyltransferase
VSDPISVRARFERFPATVKGAFIFRGEDANPHQVAVEGARVAGLGAGGSSPVPLSPVTLDVVPHRDVFVPFELPLSELEPGWYTLVCDVDVDGIPASYDGGRRFSVPWPRATVRRGQARSVVRCVWRMRRCTPSSDCPATRSSCTWRERPASHDQAVRRRTSAAAARARARRRDGRGKATAYPLMRTDEALRVELKDAAGVGGRGRHRPAVGRLDGVSAGRGSVRAVAASLLDALFPKRCAGCGSGPWPFCARCRSELVVLSPPWCERCGAPASRAKIACRDCPPDPIAIARAPFGFDGPIRRAVHRLKFGGWRAVADALAGAMVESWADVPWTPSAVTWVPLSRDRLAARGYDQARALARAVAPMIGAPALPLLRRVGDPGPQARRGAARVARRCADVRGRGGIGHGRARRRRAHHRCDGSGMRFDAAGGRGRDRWPAHRGSSRVLGTAASAYTRPRARVRVCGCPGERIPGSRCQPRAKRPT